jgi:DNA-directed RNA polymerase II subunit RPB1
LNHREFEHNYRVDVTEVSFPSFVDDNSLTVKLDEEDARLVEDGSLLREFVFGRVYTNQPHYPPVNLHCILQNAIQKFLSP